MPSFDEAPIIDLGKTPIPGSNPCGEDAAENEAYLAAAAEMARVGRIDATEEPEWFVMEQSCRTVLQSESKDIEVATWLGHALFKKHSYAGLSATLGLLTELVRNFWDSAFPSRPRRRKARIEALANRFTDGQWFKENPPKPNDFDALDACIVRAEELKAALAEKMPDDPLDLGKFVPVLKSAAAKRPKPAAASAPAAPAGDGSAAPAAAGGGTFAAGEVADTGAALTAIRSACTYLRKAEVSDPIPYACIRVLKWSSIALPASDEAKTQIPPPEATQVDALTHQHANGLWEHLLKGAEGAFRSGDPLWLDLQRYVCAAMTGLGSKFDKARAAVESQTAALVDRLGSGVFELRFRNGNPLTSGETKMWIESELVAAGGDAGGTSSASSSDNGRLSEASAAARKLAGSGKLKEGLKKLHEGLQTCTQRRERFMWRLRIAQLCFESQRLQLAAPLLEKCFAEIERFHVDEWEPSLAVEVAQTLYRCRKTLTLMEKNPSPETIQRVRDSFAWLCQLDPLAALAVEPSGK